MYTFKIFNANHYLFKFKDDLIVCIATNGFYGGGCWEKWWRMHISSLNYDIFTFWCQLSKRKYFCSNSPSTERNQKLPSQTGPYSRSKDPVQAALCKSSIGWRVRNQAAININISLMWVITLQQLWGAPCWSFTASKNTSRQCHYFAFKPGMLSATASPFTAFPLQIHRSLRKVKKAGPVYFGRWNIFWKSNRSAIFSFRWLREQRDPWACLCKLQEPGLGGLRAGCQRWHGSPDDCNNARKWQMQSFL